MVYIDSKCKLPIRDEEAIIKLATTLCERKTPGNTYQFFIPAEEHAHITEGTKSFYYTHKINPYQIGDMVIFYDSFSSRAAIICLNSSVEISGLVA